MNRESALELLSRSKPELQAILMNGQVTVT